MRQYIIAILAVVVSASASLTFAAPDTTKSRPEKKVQFTARQKADRAKYYFYADANRRLQQAPVAVFAGDSITYNWASKRPDFFAQNNYVGRGISGQTTLQILARFHQDVVSLKPKAVLILAGCNDIAENSGPISLENVAGNIFSMAEIAKSNGIVPVICSILPAYAFPWNKSIKTPAEKVKVLNEMLKTYAKEKGVLYLDYHSKVVDERGGLPSRLANDGIHPTVAGYEILEPMAKAVIDSIK